jgi:hypothetical protein
MGCRVKPGNDEEPTVVMRGLDPRIHLFQTMKCFPKRNADLGKPRSAPPQKSLSRRSM